ncbi:unnamed protein product [Nippostrongylus brasiliensis]|uniref:G_PROTEIN_RECEP_F1_2 domain-containing protein n=1 Tax=Nippostrongylus brasiliensis TaxID=27835 RepID=A0A0N4Y604_NIPBR|nr:unnamed protein product [Nippostrongylus brasiliensis]
MSRRKIGQVSFFALAGQILACDLGQLSTQLVVAFPLSLWGTNIYKGYTTIWIYTIFNVIDTISYNGVLWFTFVMAVNRLTVFIMPKLHQLLFSPSVVWRSIVLVWCVILVQVAGVNVLQCWKQFSYNKFYFYIRCYNSSSTLSFIWLDVMRYLSFALPVIMFVFYIYLFVFLRLTSPSHHGASRTSMVAARKTEINLLIQAVVVTAFLELQTLSFTFLPKLGTGFGEYYSSLAQNVISILNNSINPYVRLKNLEYDHRQHIPTINAIGVLLWLTIHSCRGKCKASLRPFLKMGLFFNILIIFSLIFVAIAVYVGASREKLIFKSYEVPIIASTYDEVAVVTNSVACNDIASATCHVLDVFRSWDDGKEDKLERTPERSSFYKDYGDLKKSVAYPTEAIVMLHLFQKIPKNEKLRLVEDLQVFLKSQIPVSPTLGKHLRYTSMLHLLFDKHGLGELMEAPTWIKEMFEDEKPKTSKVEKQDTSENEKQDTSENEKQDTSEDEKQETSEDQKRAMNVSDDVKIVMLTKSISKKLEEFTRLSHLELQGRNYSNLSEAVRKYIKRLEIDEEFNGEKVCIPTPFDSMMGRLENSFKG